MRGVHWQGEVIPSSFFILIHAKNINMPGGMTRQYCMKRSIRNWLIVCVCGAIVVGMLYVFVFRDWDETPYPDTLPVGSTPVIGLPIPTNDILSYLGGFGDTGMGFFHGGLEFGNAKLMPVYALHVAYVVNITPFFLASYVVFQVNVQFSINSEWGYFIQFEPLTPVSDKIHNSGEKGGYRYEAWFHLEQDPALFCSLTPVLTSKSRS